MNLVEKEDLGINYPERGGVKYLGSEGIKYLESEVFNSLQSESTVYNLKERRLQSESTVLETRTGGVGGGGTWGHKLLAIHFAQWISPQFHI